MQSVDDEEEEGVSDDEEDAGSDEGNAGEEERNEGAQASSESAAQSLYPDGAPEISILNGLCTSKQSLP